MSDGKPDYKALLHTFEKMLNSYHMYPISRKEFESGSDDIFNALTRAEKLEAVYKSAKEMIENPGVTGHELKALIISRQELGKAIKAVKGK